MPLDSAVITKLQCPACQSSVTTENQHQLQCDHCDSWYEAKNIIDFLLDTSQKTALEDADYDDNAGYNKSVINSIETQWTTVFDNAGIDPEDKDILEIGAGTGVLTVALLQSTQRSRIFATDLSNHFLETTVKRAKNSNRLTAIRCDCNSLPVHNSNFDLIVGRSILHHLIDYDRVLEQCSRILKPGGTAIFFEPILEGKLTIAMFIAMIVDMEKSHSSSVFSIKELNKMESIVRHITKSSWYPQTRESLEKIEDKYIFSIEKMKETASKAGFSNTKLVNDNRPVDHSYWSNFIMTMRLLNLDTEKFKKYKFLSESYARTFGLYDELTTQPMGYFCFKK